MVFVFGLIDFTKILQLKGLKSKNKDHTNFYECCDLTKKEYLIHIYIEDIIALAIVYVVQEVILVILPWEIETIEKQYLSCYNKMHPDFITLASPYPLVAGLSLYLYNGIQKKSRMNITTKSQYKKRSIQYSIFHMNFIFIITVLWLFTIT